MAISEGMFAIIILVLLLIIAYPNFFVGRMGPNFISVSPREIDLNKGEKVVFTIKVSNPPNSEYELLNPFVAVNYNNSAFSSRNRDIRDFGGVYLNSIKQGEEAIYYLEFLSSYQQSTGKYDFVFDLYDEWYSDERMPIQSKRVVVYVK